MKRISLLVTLASVLAILGLILLPTSWAATCATCCYWDSFIFSVDSWITSAPPHSILATFTWNGHTYPAFVVAPYGRGRAVYAPGSTSVIDNVTSPGNVKHQLFINSIRWLTRYKPPAQARILITYGHQELLTYHYGGACCSSNIIQALTEEGYTPDIVFDVPASLTGYDVVIMPGVGWYGTPGYPNPLYWSGGSGHAPTTSEVNALLAFVQNGGGLYATVEWNSGASWMNPVGNPMGVTFEAISSASPLTAYRIVEHPIFVKECTTVPVSVDIKPRSCPNPVNPRSRGVLPVAILGTADFDVANIDPVSVRLQGVAPLRSGIEDVSRPGTDPAPCACTAQGRDGYADLTFKFDTQAIVATLPSLTGTSPYRLTLSGSLRDGTPITGQDCIILVPLEWDAEVSLGGLK